MKRLARAAVLCSAAVLAIAATPRAANWLATFAAGDGAHVMGNPQAKVKLTEFVSYTCPHCANFERESEGALKLHLVQPGKINVEVRHIVRDPIDLTVAMLVQCGPKEKFFGNHTAFLVRQDDWLDKARAATPAQQQRWSTGTDQARWRAIAGDLGLYIMMEARGYSRGEIDACLNPADALRIATQSRADGTKYGVNGTPSFALNGTTLANVHSWASLQARLETALSAE
jgi:protein-disulfide isomerase